MSSNVFNVLDFTRLFDDDFTYVYIRSETKIYIVFYFPLFIFNSNYYEFAFLSAMFQMVFVK